MNEKFSVRLRRERERLNLTQKDFAEKVGVSRMSQVNYESGKRYPGEEYFEALKGIGVDDFYLVFGTRTDDLSDEAHAAKFLLMEIASQLLLDTNAFNEALEEMTHLVPESIESDDSDLLSTTGAIYLSGVLSGSPVILDERLLSEVIEGLEAILQKGEAAMPPEKKAKAVLMLYRASKAAGKVDPVMIREAVTLAIS